MLICLYWVLYVITEKVRMGVGVHLSLATFQVLVVEIQINIQNNSKTIIFLMQRFNGTFSTFCVVPFTKGQVLLH